MKLGKSELTLAENGGSVEGGVYDGTGWSILESAGIEKKGDQSLLTLGGVFLPVGEGVGFFFAGSVCGSGGDGLAIGFDQAESKVVSRIADAKSSSLGFEAEIEAVERIGDHSDGAGEEFLV